MATHSQRTSFTEREHPDKTDPRVWRVAQILDRPSVYMGGPRASSFRKAQQIVDELDAMEWEARGLT